MIRKIKAEDLGGCGDLYSRVFSRSPWLEKWNKENSRNRIEHFFHSKGFVGLLSERKNITGFVLGNTEPFIEGDLFYLREMCVDVDCQRQGVGEKLLMELKNQLILKSVQNIYLATDRGTPAASFYEKNGFLKEGVMTFYCKNIQ